MIILFIIAGITIGILVGIFQGLSPPEVEAPEPEPIPPYIFEQIEAIDKQLEVNRRIIAEYDDKLSYTSNTETRNLYNKRIADLKYKNSKLSEKAYKLWEKLEG